MCIIIYKPVGQKLNKETLKYCQSKNRDGSGYMIATNGHLHIVKYDGGFDRIYNDYERHIINKGLEESIPVAFHFRIRTHGDVNAKNSHPFRLTNGDDWAFMHNGVIHGVDSKKDDVLSDTLIFKNNILDKLPKDFMNNSAILQLIYEYIGAGSKLLFMSGNGDVKVFNESKGYWDSGIWYSNGGYKQYPLTYSTGYTRNYNHWGNGVAWMEDDDYYNDGIVKRIYNMIPSIEQEKTIKQFMDGSIITPMRQTIVCKSCGKLLIETLDRQEKRCSTCRKVLVDTIERGYGQKQLPNGVTIYD